MARRNRPDNPFTGGDGGNPFGNTNPYQAAPSGGGSGGGRSHNPGNNKKKKKKKRPGEPDLPGDPLEDDAAAPGDATTDDPTTVFAAEDPQAFFRGLLQSAGYNPYVNSGFGEFLNNTLAANFEGGWNQFQTNPANVNATIYDYAAGQGYGIPTGYLQGQAGTPGTPGAPGAEIPRAPGVEPLDFNTWLKQNQSINQNQFQGFNPGRQDRLRENYNTWYQSQIAALDAGAAPTVAAVAGTAGTPGAATYDWTAFQNWIRAEIDKYSPQTLGIYDAGKRPTSTRWNLFG